MQQHNLFETWIKAAEQHEYCKACPLMEQYDKELWFACESIQDSINWIFENHVGDELELRAKIVMYIEDIVTGITKRHRYEIKALEKKHRKR